MQLLPVSEEDASTTEERDTDLSSPEDASERKPSSDSPDELVRREDLQVNLFRLLIVAIQLTAAIITSALIHRGLSAVNRIKFESSFQAVAERITSAAETDFLLKISTLRSITAGAEALMRGSSPLTTTLNTLDWEELSVAARLALNSPSVSWSPYIQSDEDRLVFEEYAQRQTFKHGPHPPCFICEGDPTRGFTNPEKVILVPGVGQTTCGSGDAIGRRGIMPPPVCTNAKQLLIDLGCVCGDIPKGTQVPTNIIEKPDFIVGSDVSMPIPFSAPPYLPTWQTATFGDEPQLMFDQMFDPRRRSTVEEIIANGIPAVTGMAATPGENDASFYLMFPLRQMNEIVVIVSMEMAWSDYFAGVFPDKADLVDFVVENTCGNTYTFKIDLLAGKLALVGTTDLHDPRFDDYSVGTTFADFRKVLDVGSPIRLPPEYNPMCGYRYTVYPTEEFWDEFITNEPFLYAVLAAGIFLFTTVVFGGYDVIVRRRQTKIMLAANRTNSIVTSLFPENVRSRMYEHQGAEVVEQSSENNNIEGQKSPPIADLYPMATIVVIDISNFTSWCSERSPEQVFTLLESLYGAFDRMAKLCGAYKVETIGDSYLAVCGVPSARSQHAVIMARFAHRCLHEMIRITTELEVVLGPGTGDLRARVGVLRGEKSRFQLFGDTINMASRMESTGHPHRIHVSKATANLLIKAGKGHWVHQREDDVLIKGKGMMNTYWIKPEKASRTFSVASASSTGTNGEYTHRVFDYVASLEQAKADGNTVLIKQCNTEAIKRLVRWNVEVLFLQLQEVCSRKAVAVSDPQVLCAAETAILDRTMGNTPMDEISQVVEMPKFHFNETKGTMEHPELVKAQLLDFVTDIAGRYRDVPFHNFHHASHVVASITKLMSRIVRPDDMGVSSSTSSPETWAASLHQSTYGISSDPLLRFAVCFAALIHDVDHTGLTNAELTSQGCESSEYYNGKSVAEQNSIDIAWKLLMEDRFTLLRRSIYGNEADLHRFRQLIVNAVLATDIADKDLKTMREHRWSETFAEGKHRRQPDTFDRRASVIFEYIIQASDICHTMQHKFNSRLFEERYLAFMSGHLEKDPSLGWYGGELWFFDNYIIPLANKLDKCGVFGVTYSEFATYSNSNRSEWEQKGKTIVQELKESCLRKFSNDGMAEHQAEEGEIYV